MRRNCASWKRCCLLPRSRSTRRSSPAGCRPASMCARCSTQLQEDYASRGVNLVRVGGKWTLRTAGDLAWLLTREAVVSRKLSRAAIETLAIVAYHQPVTRAEIEEIRGVTTSKGTLDVLLETGWVRLRGRRKAPGRPVTYGTTEAFLVAFRAGGAGRSARARRTQGRRPDRRLAARGLCRADAVRRSGACARTRSRSNPAISTSASFRRPIALRNRTPRPQATILPRFAAQWEANEARSPCGVAPCRLRLFLPPATPSFSLKSIPCRGRERGCGRRISWAH